ncbi:MAG: hypothetical protein EZS28_040012 [Streblomastix strix]|uniref:Uncharacterized protein n=1 Tax=Streblomastix strix TaxID=222440 RepID=A0A5J4U378_9EUKA|nr:MAG: hypothetical protein EZS28_040012 [Streblomastix strix]
MILTCQEADGYLVQVGNYGSIQKKAFSHQLIRNAIKNAILQLQILSAYDGKLKDSSTFLRKNEIKKIIGAECPTPIDTRWMSFSNIAIWILNLGSNVLSKLGREFLESVKHLHLFAMAVESQRESFSFCKLEYFSNF